MINDFNKNNEEISFKKKKKKGKLVFIILIIGLIIFLLKIYFKDRFIECYGLGCYSVDLNNYKYDNGNIGLMHIDIPKDFEGTLFNTKNSRKFYLKNYELLIELIENIEYTTDEYFENKTSQSVYNKVKQINANGINWSYIKYTDKNEINNYYATIKGDDLYLINFKILKYDFYTNNNSDSQKLQNEILNSIKYDDNIFEIIIGIITNSYTNFCNALFIDKIVILIGFGIIIFGIVFGILKFKKHRKNLNNNNYL